MIKKTVEEAINLQINRELYSSYLYLSMAAYYEKINLPGFANWMRVQAKEENDHAMKFFDYLLERGGEVKLLTIDAPKTEWDTPLQIFEEAYEHEQKVTAWINELADLAVKESDHATQILLHWFITEQIEEEANSSKLVEKMKLIADSKPGIFMIDAELATRVYTPIPNAAK